MEPFLFFFFFQSDLDLASFLRLLCLINTPIFQYSWTLKISCGYMYLLRTGLTVIAYSKVLWVLDVPEIQICILCFLGGS